MNNSNNNNKECRITEECRIDTDEVIIFMQHNGGGKRKSFVNKVKSTSQLTSISLENKDEKLIEMCKYRRIEGRRAILTQPPAYILDATQKRTVCFKSVGWNPNDWRTQSTHKLNKHSRQYEGCWPCVKGAAVRQYRHPF